jgi:acyl carrier protein
MGANGLEAEIKELIVEALALTDVTPADIGTDDPLFGEGLGLDSIDALELAMALTERYGVEIQADNEENRRIFTSVRTLADHVRQFQGNAGTAP